MRLIEPTVKKVEKSSLDKNIEVIKDWLPFGKTQESPEEAVIERFKRGLDNRFTLLHNLQLEASGPVFPPILIGPCGLVVLNLSTETGFFKAKENSWFKLDNTSHQFNPGRPNLIKQSQDLTQKLGAILDAHEKSHPEITPVLIFANAGVHIETTNPAIRLVLMDGIDSLIATFMRSREVLSPNEINYLSDALELMSDPSKALPMGEGEDFFGRDLFVPEKKAPPKMPSISIPKEMTLQPVEEKLKFSRKQWIILGVLLLLTIVVLMAAILYALSVV
jgi:hypothetical protein